MSQANSSIVEQAQDAASRLASTVSETLHLGGKTDDTDRSGEYGE